MHDSFVDDTQESGDERGSVSEKDDDNSLLEYSTEASGADDMDSVEIEGCHSFLDRQFTTFSASDDVEEAFSEAERDEEVQLADIEDSLVFPQCPLTLNASVLLIKKFQMRHKLTQVAISDLLQLMKLHFPSPNCFPSSLFLFNKHLPLLRDPLDYNFFCSRCLEELPQNDLSVCPNTACKQSLTGLGAISSFIELPLEPQLTTILQSKSPVMLYSY